MKKLAISCAIRAPRCVFCDLQGSSVSLKLSNDIVHTGLDARLLEITGGKCSRRKDGVKFSVFYEFNSEEALRWLQRWASPIELARIFRGL